MSEQYGEGRLLINGVLRDAEYGKTFNNINPATEQVIGVAADATVNDMEEAIQAARDAFDKSGWSTNHSLRLTCLKQLQQALKDNIDELRFVTNKEVGAPMGIVKGPQCDGPIEMMAWTLDYLEAFEWERDIGNYESVGILSKRIVRKEAAGVVAAITPWNFPLQIILAKVIPALAAGCTIILKPATETPWTATVFGRLVAEHTDIPAGVLNVITSEDPVLIGDKLTADSRVDVVSFTGSTEVGKHIMRQGAESLTRVFLELGGKSANIVLDDADMGSALLSCLAVCFHAGQGCAIPTRLLVPKAKLAEAEALLETYFGFITYGDPESDEIMGPLVSAKQRERVLTHIERAKADGARLLLGGGRPTNLNQGFYVQPTVFSDVHPDSALAQEEVFGPVLAVIPFDDEADAIAIANNSLYGLSGMVWSDTDEHALTVARQIRTGTINVNGGNFLGPDAPFGGYKHSGMGREMGPEGFAEYLETKTIAIKVEA